MIDLTTYRHYSDILIETGTGAGAGVQRAIDAGFTKVISIELHQELFNKSMHKFRNEIDSGVVSLFNMKSYEVLPVILNRLHGPAVFFLDAHPAGPTTAGHLQLLSGDSSFHQDSIITKELLLILAHRPDHVIIIDDQQGLDNYTAKYIRMAVECNGNYRDSFADNGKYLILEP